MAIPAAGLVLSPLSKSIFRSMVPNIQVDFQFLRIQAGSVVLESVLPLDSAIRSS
jgi:hypothetical protein